MTSKRGLFWVNTDDRFEMRKSWKVSFPMKRKVILTCAVTGGMDYNLAHPNFPVTPQQIADAALEAEEAGASCVHLHVRDPKTGRGSRVPDIYLDMVERVRANGVRAIINVTCGHGGRYYPDPEDESRGGHGTDIASAEERVRHLEMTRPEVASLDVCTQNQHDGKRPFVYLNTEDTLRKMARSFKDLGVKAEIEVFSPGDILLANQMLEEGLFTAPPLYQIVLGTKWGMPARAESIEFMRSLMPRNAVWAAFGIARMQMPMVAQAYLLGGNVRVGLEDNLYLKRGVFATNGQLVARAKGIIEWLGGEIATPDEAREMLGLDI